MNVDRIVVCDEDRKPKQVNPGEYIYGSNNAREHERLCDSQERSRCAAVLLRRERNADLFILLAEGFPTLGLRLLLRFLRLIGTLRCSISAPQLNLRIRPGRARARRSLSSAVVTRVFRGKPHAERRTFRPLVAGL